LDPLGRRVMGRMRAARYVIHEEWLVGTDRTQAAYVFDGIIGHRRCQVPTGVCDVWVNRRSVPEQIRLPLVGIAADEAVEVVEAHAGGPLSERAVLARLEGRRVVVLAEP